MAVMTTSLGELSVDQNEQLCRLVVGSGKRALQLRQESFQVYEKGAQDYVTTVDRELDWQLSQGMQQLFPVDGIITEESTASRSVFHDRQRRLWLIDPIDGTEEFIHGGSGYAVMVGCLERYHPQAGWIYAPARQELYWGGVNWGLFWSQADGRPQVLQPVCPLPPAEDYCPLLIGHRDRQRYGTAIATHLPMAQCYSLGSFGLKVMEVIRGRAGLYLYLNGRVKLWDTVGPLALARAAGLICCDLQGHPIRFDPQTIEDHTLVHRQAILVGWPSYIEPLLPGLQRAVEQSSSVL